MIMLYPALDILGCLPEVDCCGKIEEEVYIDREAIIEWIYSLQTLPVAALPRGSSATTDDDGGGSDGDSSGCNYIGGGFKGGAFLGPLPNASSVRTDCEEDHCQYSEERHPYDHSHLAMTYVALCTLVALGDDLSRIHKDAILHTLQSLQKEDGSFVAVSLIRPREATSASTHHPSFDDDDDESDLRFMYTAVSIWYLLVDRTGRGDDTTSLQIINIESATSYILSCISYDGALALTPGREGHGGSTFCGIASLFLMGVLDEVMAREELAGWKENLIRWCVMRQYPLPHTNSNNDDSDEERANDGYCEGEGNAAAGMQGRPNKLEDTCYSYWIGGTLHLLGLAHVLDGWALREYVLSCQSPFGGFGKVLGAMPDLLHSFYSLAWLSLSNEQQCCCEEVKTRSKNGEQFDGRNTDNGTIHVAYESEVMNQVNESMSKLSSLDCALGMCTKRNMVGARHRR